MDQSRMWKRKKLIVSPSFQWGIVVKTVLFTVTVSALFAWFTFYFLWRSSISKGNLSQVELLYQPGLWIGWGLCLLASISIVVIFLLKTTHRIAGQMYRFEKTLDQVICGDTIKPIMTRKDDYFHDFESDLNQYLNREN